MILQDVSEYFSIFASVIAFVGIPLVLLQLRMAQRQRKDAKELSTSQVLLAADGVLAAYRDVAAMLRPGGVWAEDGKNRPRKDEFVLAEPYLGVFERIFIAVANGQVDDGVVDAMYGYRLANIWNNERLVKEKLQDAKLKTDWKHLIALTYVVEAQRKYRLRGHTDKYFPSDLFDERRTEHVRKSLNERQLGLEASSDPVT
jgi:hypothetical protein